MASKNGKSKKAETPGVYILVSGIEEEDIHHSIDGALKMANNNQEDGYILQVVNIWEVVEPDERKLEATQISLEQLKHNSKA